MYLANYTRPDIALATNLLVRFSSSSTRRHWNRIKHVFCYLREITDLGLFYPRESKQEMIGYADANYLSDPYKIRSQTVTPRFHGYGNVTATYIRRSEEAPTYIR